MVLQEGKKYIDEIKNFIEEKSDGTISCEEQSLYRALRKYEHIDVLIYDLKEENKGLDRKYYYLTNLGKELFAQFVYRNIKLFYSTEIKKHFKIKRTMKTITPYLLRFAFTAAVLTQVFRYFLSLWNRE